MDNESMQKQQYDEIDHYFDEQITGASKQRAQDWRRDFSSLEAYEKSIDAWRDN